MSTSRALSPEDAEALKARLELVLTQVRLATRDWKPMLARLDQAISDFRYAPVPLEKEAVTEAIAFLEWLRDDNFTFLGMREFKYSGGEKSGTLKRSDKPGLGILADPDIVILRRESGQDGINDARDPGLLAWAGPADRDQGERQVARAPPRLSRLHRRQDLHGQRCAGRGTAHRRSLHVDRLHPFGPENPLSACQGANGPGEVRLRSGRPLRQGTDQRPGILSARRIVPDSGTSTAPQRRVDPGADGATARARFGARRPVRPLRLRARLRAPRPLRQPRARAHRRIFEDGVRGAAFRLLSGLSIGCAGARPLHHRPFGRQDARGPSGDHRGRDPGHHPQLGGRAARAGRSVRRRRRPGDLGRALPRNLSRLVQSGRSVGGCGKPGRDERRCADRHRLPSPRRCA